jgi:hypothetical protein
MRFNTTPFAVNHRDLYDVVDDHASMSSAPLE